MPVLCLMGISGGAYLLQSLITYSASIESRHDKMSFLSMWSYSKEERPLRDWLISNWLIFLPQNLKLPQDKAAILSLVFSSRQPRKMFAALSFKAFDQWKSTIRGLMDFISFLKCSCRDREEIMMEMIDQLFVGKSLKGSLSLPSKGSSSK